MIQFDEHILHKGLKPRIGTSELQNITPKG